MRPSRGSARSLGILSLRQLGSCGRALAALEFALIAPVLLLTTFAAFDIVQGLIALNRLTNVATAVSELGTEMAATPTYTNTLSRAQANAATSAIYALMPELSGASPPVFGVVLSSIAMTKNVAACRSNCTYSPHVAWSAALQGTNGTVRPCDVTLGVPVLVFVPDTQDPSPGTLPVSVQGVQPVLVADVSYMFQPLFSSFSFPPLVSGFSMPTLTMTRSVYFALRNTDPAQWLQYSDIPVPEFRCPGYHP